jgi:hypothetical protein
MNIGIIGSGNVGGTLGTRWAQIGHNVVFGSRNPGAGDLKQVVTKAGTTARAATLQEAATSSEVLLLATPWPATQQVVESLGDLTGKIMIDATNPLFPNLQGLEQGTTTSGGELVARWAKGATVVKAFNTIGANIMERPAFGNERPVLFYCGGDAEAKKVADHLATEIGFDAMDAGPLTQARALEPFALLWVSLAYAQGLGRDIAFKLLRR